MDPTVPSPTPEARTYAPPSPDSPVPLSEMRLLLTDPEDLEGFLQHVTVLGAAAMSTDCSCVIAVELPDRPMIVASSQEDALAVGKIECAHRDGPCLETWQTGRPLYVPDLTHERRWRAFTSAALAHGMRSSLSVPLQGPTRTVGVLSLYATWAHAYDQVAQGRAQAFSDNITNVIGIALRLADQIRLNDDLRSALASRSVIDQAIGIIMAENRCDREMAFEVLRHGSQHCNIKLREVAASLVHSITGHQPTPGPFCPRR